MIDNLHPRIVILGVGLFPLLMGNFDYPLPSNDVNLILVVLDQPRTAMFQVYSFKMNYFNNPWNLPSPSALMEWIWHLGMAMPLSVVEVAYNIVPQTSANPS